MSMTWQVFVQLPNGSSQLVKTQADSAVNAQQLFEAQYGKGALRGYPTLVSD